VAWTLKRKIQIILPVICVAAFIGSGAFVLQQKNISWNRLYADYEKLFFVVWEQFFLYYKKIDLFN